MNKEMILKLIDSEDQQTIATTLAAWYQKDPSLSLLTFTNQCTIFHLLVLKNKPLVIKQLLKNVDLKLLATKTDMNQKTPLHYAVKHEKYKEVFDHLVAFLPRLDDQDKEGNTVLHKAVIKKQIWAIIALVKSGKVDKLLQNKENKTALDLAQNNSSLFKAIMYLDLVKVPSFGAKVTDTPNSLDRLKDTFPLLSTPKSNRESSESSTEKSPSSISWRSFLNLHDNEEEDDLEIWHLEEIKTLFSQMVLAYKNNPTQYPGLLKQFISTCKRIDFSERKDILRSIFKALNDNQDILDELFNNLSTELQDSFASIQAAQKQLMESFICLIINESLHLNNGILTEPPFKEILADKEDFLELLWSLTAGIDPRESKGKRKINLEGIMHAAFYLQSKSSFIEVLNRLQKLFPYFDRHQKLVANYVVWQLLTCNANEHFLPDANFHEQLNQFNLCNRKNEKELGQIGAKLSTSLNTLVKRCGAIFYHPLWTNYQSIRKMAMDPSRLVVRQSFNELVERALKIKKNERIKEVKCIAQELRLLSIEFYQKIVLNEFTDLNWTKEDPNLAANILRQTTRFNHISNYFLAKVLNQTSIEKTVNVLELLIQIAQELCPLVEGQFIDLHHIMIIISVLDNSFITRLKPYMSVLEEADQAIVAELRKIVDFGQNKYWQRVIQSSCKTLPYSGLFQGDLTFAKEGNESPLGRAEAYGNILLKILAIKQLVKFRLLTPRTDLIQFIDAYKPVSDKSLYELSLRKFPKETKSILDFDAPEKLLFRSLDELTWNDLEGYGMPPCKLAPAALGEKLIGAWLLISELNYNFLDQYIIPQIKFKEKIYSSLAVGNKLIDFFMSQLKELELPEKNETEPNEKSVKKLFLLALADKISNTVQRFIFIHNNYQRSNLSAKNLFLLESRVIDMKEALAKKIEMDMEFKPQRNANPVKRKSLSFFGTNKITPTEYRSYSSEPTVRIEEDKPIEKRPSWFTQKNAKGDILSSSSHIIYPTSTSEEKKPEKINRLPRSNTLRGKLSGFFEPTVKSSLSSIDISSGESNEQMTMIQLGKK